MKKSVILGSISTLPILAVAAISASCQGEASVKNANKNKHSVADIKEFHEDVEFLESHALEYKLIITNEMLEAEAKRIEEVYEKNKNNPNAFVKPLKANNDFVVKEKLLPPKGHKGYFTFEYLITRGIIGKLAPRISYIASEEHKKHLENLILIPVDFGEVIDKNTHVAITYKAIFKKDNTLTKTFKLDLGKSTSEDSCCPGTDSSIGFIHYGKNHNHCTISVVGIDPDPSKDYEQAILKKYLYNLSFDGEYLPVVGNTGKPPRS